MNLTHEDIIRKYENGQRNFEDIEVEAGNLSGRDLKGISFKDCFLVIDFSHTNLSEAKFVNSNIKTCDFRGANLSRAYFNKVAIDGAEFHKAIIDETIFKENYAQGSILGQDDLSFLVNNV